MTWDFTKKYSQTDCSTLLKILYLAPGSSKKMCTNINFAFFVQSQIYHLQLSVVLFMCVTVFAFFPFFKQNVDSGKYLYKEVDNKSQNYMQSNIIMSNIWCLLSFLFQTLLKLFLLLVVTYTMKHFKFCAKIYHYFALFHINK